MDITLAAMTIFLVSYALAVIESKDFNHGLERVKKGRNNDVFGYYPTDLIQHLPDLTEVSPTQHFPLEGLDTQQLSNLRLLMATHTVCAGCFLEDVHNLSNCAASLIVCEAGSMCVSAKSTPNHNNDQCPTFPLKACCSHSGSNRKCRNNSVGIRTNINSCQQLHYEITTCSGFLCNVEDYSKVQTLQEAMFREHNQPLDTWSGWSVWSQCSATCGSGSHVRMRHCYQANSTIQKTDCPGMSVEIQSCPNLLPCQNPDSWSSWNEWTACTATCGNGSQIRTRNCQRESGSTANDCPGVSIESRICATQECPGVLSEWLSWTSCPSACGTGIQFRERFCNYPGTTNISRNCHGETVEQKVCHLMDCPVDGLWGLWGEWGACLAGRQIRSRKCDSPSPQEGGKECYSDDKTRDIETRTCDVITTSAPRVLEPPIIYGNSSTFSGGNVSLLCLTTIAGVSVTWYYKENESLPLHVVQPQGTTHLIITDASIHNTGTYTCRIADKELSSEVQQAVTMQESAAKIVSLTSQPSHITEGANVQLECKALGYPEPIIRWGYKDTFGNPYVPPPVQYTNGGKTIQISSYQSVLYGGTWTCSAVNKLGADHTDITI